MDLHHAVTLLITVEYTVFYMYPNTRYFTLKLEQMVPFEPASMLTPLRRKWASVVFKDSVRSSL